MTPSSEIPATPRLVRILTAALALGARDLFVEAFRHSGYVFLQVGGRMIEYEELSLEDTLRLQLELAALAARRRG